MICSSLQTYRHHTTGFADRQVKILQDLHPAEFSYFLKNATATAPGPACVPSAQAASLRWNPR
jgi:hypothetical protein